MSGEFIDTNVLIYAHDRSAGIKHEIALDLLAHLDETKTGALSIQVLVEFYSVGTRKLPLGPERAEQIIADYASWLIHRPSHADLLDACRFHRRHKLSWWDALLVTSALVLKCSVLWTEDLSHGHRFGSLTIRNPFKEGVAVPENGNALLH